MIGLLLTVPPPLVTAAESDVVSAPVSFLQSELVRLRIDEMELRRERDVAAAELAGAERRWSESRNLIENSESPSPALGIRVSAHWEERILHETRKNWADRLLEHLGRERTVLEHLDQVRNDEFTLIELQTWRREARNSWRLIDGDSSFAIVRATETATELEAIATRFGDTRLGAEERRWIRSLKRSLEARAQVIAAAQARLKSQAENVQSARDEMQVTLAAIPVSARIFGIFERLLTILRVQLLEVDGRPLTIGMVLVALVLFLFGLPTASVLSRFIAKRVISRFTTDLSAREAIEALLYYSLLLLVTMIALLIARVPLSLFTVLGGALALGVGFGSQNIINNFMSGLILMVERPIRVGDIVEVDGVVGTVLHIGARSTHIRTPDNISLVVPNSLFIESKLVNWTLSDVSLRRHVAVGVAYGSPTERVKELLLRAVESNEQVMKDPTPIVLFENFGDNALIFEVLFWITLRRPIDRRLVESTIRFDIDRLFRENGITISYPQRDVHLDTLRPLDVRLVPPSSDPPPPVDSNRSG